jgi:DNA-directed RNA polymerase subunit E'/Rpb7
MFIKVLKGETEIVPERSVTFNSNDKLQCLNESNTTISPDKLKMKIIQRIFKQNTKSKCQIKLEEQYGDNIDWTQNWTK